MEGENQRDGESGLLGNCPFIPQSKVPVVLNHMVNGYRLSMDKKQLLLSDEKGGDNGLEAH